MKDQKLTNSPVKCLLKKVQYLKSYSKSKIFWQPDLGLTELLNNFSHTERKQPKFSILFNLNLVPKPANLV